MARQDQFGRMLGGLGRALRSIMRYRETFDPTPEESSRLGRAHWHVRKAMEELEHVNASARTRSRCVPQSAGEAGR